VVEGAREFIDLTRSRVGDKVLFVEGLVEDFETTARYETIFFSHVAGTRDGPGRRPQQAGPPF